MLAAQERRDKQDESREVGPLVPAADAVEVCTDGLSGASDNADIYEEITKGGDDLAATCSLLVELAKKRGGDDNITVVLVRVKDIFEEK